jgi:hypothetical protein
MKKNLYRALNFVAFNLFFVALYLNFIHKESNTVPAEKQNRSAATEQGAVLVQNPEQYLKAYGAAHQGGSNVQHMESTVSFN